jgi:hypothetical protein
VGELCGVSGDVPRRLQQIFFDTADGINLHT